MKKIRRVFKKTLSKIIPIDYSHGRMASRNRFDDLKERINTESPLIVDGGAHKGGMIDIFLGQFRSPIIHAFEPIPDLAKELIKTYSTRKNVAIHENALGADNKQISFNVFNFIGSSSVFSASDIARGYHGKKMDTSQEIQVQQVRLDEILDDEIDILKLDLQGYELEALKGCGRLLENIKTMTVEVEFVPMYDGQPLFGDIDVFLRKNGFKLLNLYELWTHPDGQLTAGDAIYLNTRYF